MEPLCREHGADRARYCDECWTLMAEDLEQRKANAPHVYSYARAEGYRAGIEAAAQAADAWWLNDALRSRTSVGNHVRALSAPAAPKAPERGEP